MLRCNQRIQQPKWSDSWAPAGTSDSIRARRPAFDKERRFDGARFVLVVSAEREGKGERVERELTFLRASAS